jgi:hypothetical protein
MVISRKDASDAGLRASALRNDLVQRGVRLSSSEVTDLITEPGFGLADDSAGESSALNAPLASTRVDLDPPLVSWQKELDELAHERQVVGEPVPS